MAWNFTVGEWWGLYHIMPWMKKKKNYFILLLKKKKKSMPKSVWIHVLMATYSETKGCTKIVQNIWRWHYKGVSVWPPANGKKVIYIENIFYVSHWMYFILLLMPLCWSSIFLIFSLLPFMTMKPLFTHPFSMLPISFKYLFEVY